MRAEVDFKVNNAFKGIERILIYLVLKVKYFETHKRLNKIIASPIYWVS